MYVCNTAVQVSVAVAGIDAVAGFSINMQNKRWWMDEINKCERQTDESTQQLNNTTNEMIWNEIKWMNK